ncbi:MAG: DUF501 domain-containing protein [Acidimicrobiia bacterium]|nr:DUF501 domain-containing protein [Acidimicrobiia bacterium]
MSDRAVVAAQIEREPRSAVDVVARCDLGLPTVIKVPPYLDDGTPFPTTYWLTCPLAVRRIGRLEAKGGVKEAEYRIASDPEFAARHIAAGERYRLERDAMIDMIGSDIAGPRPTGGVGGTRRGVKCLHAHYADYAAGNDNPVGEETAVAVEPLNCLVRCMVQTEGAVGRNPEWVEPRQ